MTDREYWIIADEYEEINKDENSYVPRQNWRALAIDICETNNRDYNQSLADLKLFRYGRKLSEEIPQVCLKTVEKLCRKKVK